jgi:glucose-6-phosphate isomerase
MVESTQTFDKLPSIQDLVNHYKTTTSKTHLRDLLNDRVRNEHLRASFEAKDSEIILDLTHTKIDQEGF